MARKGKYQKSKQNNPQMQISKLGPSTLNP